MHKIESREISNRKYLSKSTKKHSLHGKKAASFLLKLFISGNERYHH